MTMETRAHHVLIGAFTIGVFLLALGFVLWMSKSGADRRYNEYEIVFTEAVTGLSVGGLVQYNGIKVGEVSALRLAPDDPRKVIARVRLDASAPVRQDTRAKLGLQGVTGLAFIQLSGARRAVRRCCRRASIPSHRFPPRNPRCPSCSPPAPTSSPASTTSCCA
jgi:phospholipid/cholesterol/gamma-HCH transport system substrate-binding protein